MNTVERRNPNMFGFQTEQNGRLSNGSDLFRILDVRISDVKCVPTWDEKLDHFIYIYFFITLKAKTI